jgi:hypothetical protein
MHIMQWWTPSIMIIYSLCFMYKIVRLQVGSYGNMNEDDVSSVKLLYRSNTVRRILELLILIFWVVMQYSLVSGYQHLLVP